MGEVTRSQGEYDPSIRGPSPRGRGNLFAGIGGWDHARSIPAWAGKPWGRHSFLRAGRVHPRVGGETPIAVHVLRERHGPSPRGRGNPTGRTGPGLNGGSIPAWAGKPPEGHANVRAVGSIPAWAGKPWSPRWTIRRTTVHPRVGGETSLMAVASRTRTGPSPRGRGNRCSPATCP